MHLHYYPQTPAQEPDIKAACANGHTFNNKVQMGHSCKTGNVRYGGTSKTQNWNYQTFDNFVLKFFHTYVIQLDINYGPPLSTFLSPIMEDYNILDVPP